MQACATRGTPCGAPRVHCVLGLAAKAGLHSKGLCACHDVSPDLEHEPHLRHALELLPHPLLGPWGVQAAGRTGHCWWPPPVTLASKRSHSPITQALHRLYGKRCTGFMALHRLYGNARMAGAAACVAHAPSLPSAHQGLITASALEPATNQRQSASAPAPRGTQHHHSSHHRPRTSLPQHVQVLEQELHRRQAIARPRAEPRVRESDIHVEQVAPAWRSVVFFCHMQYRPYVGPQHTVYIRYTYVSV